MGGRSFGRSTLWALVGGVVLSGLVTCAGPFDSQSRCGSGPRGEPARLPAVTGGTLALVGPGLLLASVPEQCAAVLVSVRETDAEVRSWVRFGRDDEPGRVTGLSETEAAVVLRNAAAVAIVDLATGTEVDRLPTCTQPRGVGWEAGPGILWVSCADGHLVRISRRSRTRVSDVFVAEDLRDLVLTGPGTAEVTTFRSSRLFHVEATGAVRDVTGTADTGSSQRHVAWRARPGLLGGATRILSQLHTTAPVSVAPTRPSPYAPTVSGAIVQSAWQFGSGANPSAPMARIGGPSGTPVLAVDFACSSAAARCYVASAGDRTVFGTEIAAGSTSESWEVDVDDHRTAMPVAVEFVSSGLLAVQTRDPSTVSFHRVSSGSAIPVPPAVRLGDLGALESAPALFHAATPAGLACASCHPEGDDDGHVWQFTPDGPRRTPRLPPGLLSTAPFHWSGDLPSFDALVREVFVRRMVGTTLSAAATTTLGNWLDARPGSSNGLPDPSVTAAVSRGRAVFDGPGGCGECHLDRSAGPERSFDVGTGSALQAPSLVGLRWRAPYMHDGCARTLEDRFSNEACGGSRHGGVLTNAQRDDLLVYLRSL